MGLEVEVVGETNKFDVIVIGGGIAGMTASVYVTQLGLKSCFLEKEVPGGKLLHIDVIHNFPQCPNIKGSDLAVSVFNSALQNVKTYYSSGNVIAMKSKNDLFYLFTEDGITWEAKAVIIATGTVIKHLNIPFEENFNNHGLSYCVLCDAALAKGKKVVLIGSKLHIDVLKKYTNDVICVEEKDVIGIEGKQKVESIKLKNGKSIPCDMVFAEVGYTTNTKFLINEIKLNEKNEIIVDQNKLTSFVGAYAIGDCTNTDVKLATKAMEDAAVAAKNAVNYIKNKKW